MENNAWEILQHTSALIEPIPWDQQLAPGSVGYTHVTSTRRERKPTLCSSREPLLSRLRRQATVDSGLFAAFSLLFLDHEIKDAGPEC